MQQIFDYEGAQAHIVRMFDTLQMATLGIGPLYDIVDFLGQFSWIIVLISLVDQLVWGILLLIGRWVRLASVMLILYLIFWSTLTHPFWVYDGLHREEELFYFIQNIALVGALFQLIAYRKQCTLS